MVAIFLFQNKEMPDGPAECAVGFLFLIPRSKNERKKNSQDPRPFQKERFKEKQEFFKRCTPEREKNEMRQEETF